MIKILYVLISVLMLSGCAMKLQGPYRSEYPEIPEGWKNEDSEQEARSFQSYAEDLDYWWQVFDDPTLNALEDAAIQYNYNLEAALQRVFQARAVAWANFGAMFPQITFGPSLTASGGLSPFNFSTNAIPSTTIPRSVIHQYTLPMSLSYEVDIWGRLYQTYLSSAFTAQAFEDEYLTIWLQITSDVATNYYQIRSFDAQIQVLQRAIDTRREALEINQSRYEAGLIFYADVSRAEVDLASAKAQYKDAVRLRLLQENALSLLVGKAASLFCVSERPLNLEADPVVVPAGLPSTLLTRRPDIAAAERRMAATYENVGVAYTAFFPQITFTNVLGYFSPVSELLGQWQSRYWALGISALQSVFDGGQNYANLLNAKAALKESMALYEQQILQGFKDVEDALTNIQNYALIRTDLQDAVKASIITLELSRDRYMQGLSSYLDVTTAERDVLNAELTLVGNQTQRYLASILLIKALGGGWNIPFAEGDTKAENCCYVE